MADKGNLEERNVKALENIADSLDQLVEWVEEIDKDTWGERIEWYLDMWKTKFIDEPVDKKSKK